MLCATRTVGPIVSYQIQKPTYVLIFVEIHSCWPHISPEDTWKYHIGQWWVWTAITKWGWLAWSRCGGDLAAVRVLANLVSRIFCKTKHGDRRRYLERLTTSEKEAKPKVLPLPQTHSAPLSSQKHMGKMPRPSVRGWATLTANLKEDDWPTNPTFPNGYSRMSSIRRKEKYPESFSSNGTVVSVLRLRRKCDRIRKKTKGQEAWGQKRKTQCGLRTQQGRLKTRFVSFSIKVAAFAGELRVVVYSTFLSNRWSSYGVRLLITV